MFDSSTGLYRRDFLQVGLLPALGLGVAPSLLTARPGRRASAKKCILVWLDGGPSHLDTWDPKPHAPAEVRGPFASIPTAVEGIQVSELLPEFAQRMKQWTIIRSMTSPLGEHNFGTHYLLTGYRPTPALEYPSFGSVIARDRDQVARAAQGTPLRKSTGPQDNTLPGHIAIPHFRVGGGNLSGAGFLPTTYRPFAVGGDPAKPDFRVQDLQPPATLTEQRLRRRKSYLDQFDAFHRAVNSDSTQHNSAYEDAYQLLFSNAAREAFDLQREPQDVRDKYGRRTIGQSCLLARRLIERGVPFVTVNSTGWDTHANAYTRLKEGYTGAKVPVGLVPSLDVALAALVDDLRETGQLDETLIVVMGEFGRTPKINTAGGRDHWPRAFSVAMAGGGVRGGQVIGASDRTGESPADNPVTPSDLVATIYRLLDVSLETELTTADGRPIRLVSGGQPIKSI